MRFRFGEYELSLETLLLTRSGLPVPLTPKAFQLLTLLLRRRPAVVSKGEIQDVLWPDTFVVEANIANLVAEIRGALGDSARQPRYVRTATGVGYAFNEAAFEASPAGAPAAGRVVCSLVAGDRTLFLREGEHVLGRGTTCDLPLHSTAVSRRHARVTVRGSSVTIEDLGSRNGTFLRGQRVTLPAPVFDADEVRIGSVLLRFRMEADGACATEDVPVPPAAVPWTRPSRFS